MQYKVSQNVYIYPKHSPKIVPHAKKVASNHKILAPLAILLGLGAAQFDVQCDQTQLFSAPRDAFDAFIDLIPDGEWQDDDGVGFGRNEGGSLICASASPCPGCSVTGEQVRGMLRQGYDDCDIGGSGNDAGEGRFWQYRVDDGGTSILAGGGPCPGTFGVPGTSVAVTGS